MSFRDDVEATATRIGQEFRTLRASIASSLSTKADDATVVKLSGAQTVNGTKTFGSSPLVPVPAASAHPVRHDDARLADARTPTSHTHPAGAVTAAPRTVTYAALAALAPASGVAVDVVTATLTANPTITPVDGADRQVVRLALFAGSSARTVTLATAVRLSTGITTRTVAVPANQAAVLGLEYFSVLSAWVLFSTYVTG